MGSTTLELTAPAAATVARGRGGSVRSVAIALALAAVLLYFAFRGVEWDELWQRIAAVRPELIALVFVGYSFSYFLRAWRWAVLLGAGGRAPISTAFWATAVGYLGNCFLPARAGEVVRTAMMARAARLDVGFVLATAVTERVLDAVALVVIGLAALSFVPNLPEWLSSTTSVMAIGGLVGLLGLVAAPRLEGPMVALVARASFLGQRRERLLGLLSRFLTGLRAVQEPGRAVRFLLFAAAIWTADAVTTATVASALGIPLPLPLSYLLLAALGLSSAAPSTPGFVGIYQFVTVTVLVPLGYAQSSALAFILLLQAVTYAVVVFWGLPGLWRLSVARPER
jgi:uncharacterized protein (TIRG00374 family)